MDLADKIEGLAKALNGVDCPAKRASLGDKDCPKCFSKRNESCRLQANAENAFGGAILNNLPAILQALRAQEPPADVAGLVDTYKDALLDSDFDEHGFTIKRGNLRALITTITAQAAREARLRERVAELETPDIYVVAFALEQKEANRTTYSMSQHWQKAVSAEEAVGKALNSLADLKPGFTVWEKLVCGPFARAALEGSVDRG